MPRILIRKAWTKLMPSGSRFVPKQHQLSWLLIARQPGLRPSKIPEAPGKTKRKDRHLVCHRRAKKPF
jgi:hypothetical protein